MEILEKPRRDGIRHLADVSGTAREEVGAMEISLMFQEHCPPAGWLRVVPSGREADPGDESERIVFAGWMELLRTLDSVLGRSSEGGQS